MALLIANINDRVNDSGVANHGYADNDAIYDAEDGKKKNMQTLKYLFQLTKRSPSLM